MSKSFTLQVQGIPVTIVNNDYISLTDMVKQFGDDAMIYSWMRNRSTLQFIGVWEQL